MTYGGAAAPELTGKPPTGVATPCRSRCVESNVNVNAAFADPAAPPLASWTVIVNAQELAGGGVTEVITGCPEPLDGAHHDILVHAKLVSPTDPFPRSVTVMLQTSAK